MEIKYQNLRVLGPAILKVKIPDEILDKLNDYIDKIINDDSKLKKLNYGEALVGDVTQEFLLEVEFVKSSGWLEFLGNSCKIYTELNHPNFGRIRQPRSAAIFDGSAPTKQRYAPTLGQHNEEITRELGYTKADIDSLYDKNILFSSV